MNPFAEEFKDPNQSTSSHTPHLFYQPQQSQNDTSVSMESDSIGFHPGNLTALMESEQNQSVVIPKKPREHDEERCQAC